MLDKDFNAKCINIKDIKIGELWERGKVVLKIKYIGLNIWDQ